MFGKYVQTRKGLVLAAFIGSLVWSSVVLLRPARGQEPDPATQLKVNYFAVNFALAGGPKRLAFAVVDIVDGNGNPVNGALVVGNWSGCFKQLNDSAVTETVCRTGEDGTVNCDDGQAWIWANKSYSCWGKRQSCSFTFTISEVSKAGMTYVPVEGMTSASIECR
jgi:hypothetical protein